MLIDKRNNEMLLTLSIIEQQELYEELRRYPYNDGYPFIENHLPDCDRSYISFVFDDTGFITVSSCDIYNNKERVSNPKDMCALIADGYIVVVSKKIKNFFMHRTSVMSRIILHSG